VRRRRDDDDTGRGDRHDGAHPNVAEQERQSGRHQRRHRRQAEEAGHRHSFARSKAVNPAVAEAISCHRPNKLGSLVETERAGLVVVVISVSSPSTLQQVAYNGMAERSGTPCDEDACHVRPPLPLRILTGFLAPRAFL
jgi:hypothetical protein